MTSLRSIVVTCCIVGGRPVGMVRGALLAGAGGVAVLVQRLQLLRQDQVIPAVLRARRTPKTPRMLKLFARV